MRIEDHTVALDSVPCCLSITTCVQYPQVDLVTLYSSEPRLPCRQKVSSPDADTQGQPKFRGMWDRYCRGANAIV